jgi:hypothetical protein
MLSKQLIVWGYIIIPNPYLDSFQLSVTELKGKSSYTDFPDFIGTVVMTSRDPMVTFGYIFRYEEKDEIEMIKRFELFLQKIKFLSAIIQIDVEGNDSVIREFIFDGATIHRYDRFVSKSTE